MNWRETVTAVEEIAKLVNEFQERRLYGTLEFKFERGELTLIRKMFTARPGSTTPNGEDRTGYETRE